MIIGRFLNVDLEILSKVDLAPLAAELEQVGVVLHYGPTGNGYVLTFEADTVENGDPDGRIHSLCQIVEKLSPAGRALWRSASHREFNVGLDATTEHVAAQFALRRDTLRRILRLRATLGMTVYKAEPEAQKIDSMGRGLLA